MFDKKERKDMLNTNYDDYPKKIGKETYDSGGPFKLNIKDRIFMLLIYHRLYITYINGLSF